MGLGSAISSPLLSFSSQKALDLARIYLETARNASDSDIALVLFNNTEASLSQAKKSVKSSRNQTVAREIVAAYNGLGKLLEDRGHDKEAQDIFKKAKKLE